MSSDDRNPSPPPELTGESGEDLIHADSIGDTVFSKHWLFTTLMKLIQEVDKEQEGKEGKEETGQGLDVDEDLQNELCKLWDMSMNSEVAKFLQEFKAIEILTGVIAKSRAPRVTEISVGILGNMACSETIAEEIAKDDKLKELLLLLLASPDAPTLVETTRLLDTCISNSNNQESWLKAVTQDDQVHDAIKFILQSSTNCDLLRNIGRLLDHLLDLDDDLCKSWGTPELVLSLLEAIGQLSWPSGDSVDTYLHILQLVSTSESGVEALVGHAESLLVLLLAYLKHVCEDEIVRIGEREASLASCLSVLNVIFIRRSQSDGSSSAQTQGSQLMRCVLKVLEALVPELPKSSIRHPLPRYTRGVSTSESELESPTKPEPGIKFESLLQRVDENSSAVQNEASSAESCGSLPVEGSSGNYNENNNKDSQGSNGEDREEDEEEEEEEESRQNGRLLLYETIQGCLYNFLSKWKSEENSEQEAASSKVAAPGLLYLDEACSRSRIQHMLYALDQVWKQKAVETLKTLAESHDLERLRRIIADTFS